MARRPGSRWSWLIHGYSIFGLASMAMAGTSPPTPAKDQTVPSSHAAPVVPSAALLEFIDEFGDENTDTLDALGFADVGAASEPAKKKKGNDDATDTTH